MPYNYLINNTFPLNARAGRGSDQEGDIQKPAARPEIPAECADIILLRRHGAEGTSQND